MTFYQRFRAESRLREETEFVVRGKPDGFVGLDDGVFRCADNFDAGCVNVMSWRRFQRL